MVSVSVCTTRLVLIDDEKHHFDTFTDCFLPVLQLFEGLFTDPTLCCGSFVLSFSHTLPTCPFSSFPLFLCLVF